MLAIPADNCSATVHFIFGWFLACGYSFFLPCAIFPIFFAHYRLKSFIFEILKFLNP